MASYEKKLLVGVTIATLVGYLMQIIAIGTNYWLIVVFPEVAVTNSTVVVGTHSGIWLTCVVESLGATGEKGKYSRDRVPQLTLLLLSAL